MQHSDHTPPINQRLATRLTIAFFVGFILIGMAYCRFLQSYPTPDLDLKHFETRTFGIFPPLPDSTGTDTTTHSQQRPE
ncbi:MAG: hypothetical protein ACO4CH_12545 [Saprospiraceae bacterium]